MGREFQGSSNCCGDGLQPVCKRRSWSVDCWYAIPRRTVQRAVATIEAIVLERPEPEPDFPQHLCLDKGYDNETGWGACIDHDYHPHIALIRDERPARPKTHQPRRWVVERTLAWLSKCRGILIRYEKKAENYLGMLQLACGLLWFRRLHHLTAT